MFGDVAGALLAMLEDRIGPEVWTDDVKAAWTSAYLFVAEHMIRGIKKEAKKQKGSSRSSTDISVCVFLSWFVVVVIAGHWLFGVAASVLLVSFEPSPFFFLRPNA